MFEAIGGHKHYCAVYSSKDAPHMDGLLMTLADSLAAKSQGFWLTRALQAWTLALKRKPDEFCIA